MSRISNKIKSTRKDVGITFKMPKLFVPVDCHTPATAKDSVAKQLYQAGIISKSDFEKMLGIGFDGDFSPKEEVFDDETFSAYEEEFKLSELAEYYDDYSDGRNEPVQLETLSQKKDDPRAGAGDDQGSNLPNDRSVRGDVEGRARGEVSSDDGPISSLDSDNPKTNGE